jgi:FkbM family methyltransferase
LGGSRVIIYDTAEAWFQTPRGNGVLFRYRTGTSDWNTLWSCLNEDEYGLRDEHPRIAVDIGGHIGGAAVALAVDNPEARVLVVEPIPENVDLLRWAVESNKVAHRVVIVAGAVGDGSEVEVRYRHRGNESAEHHAFIGNCSLAYATAGELPHEVVTYRSLTVADILDRLGGEPDLIKIDVEGAEWAFLDTDEVAKLPYLVGEWHPVGGHHRGDLVGRIGWSHDLEFSGPIEGPGGFRARRRRLVAA